MKKRRGIPTNIYLRESVRKAKKRSANFEDKGSRVVYTWRRY